MKPRIQLQIKKVRDAMSNDKHPITAPLNLDFLAFNRKEKGLTQEDVAKKLGIGKTAYAKIETGENNLHPKHWKKIESLLSVTEKELSEFAAAVSRSKEYPVPDVSRQPVTNLKRYRMMMGLNQKELASLLGVRPPTVNTMEQKGIFDTRVASRCAAALGCNPVLLLDGLDFSPSTIVR